MFGGIACTISLVRCISATACSGPLARFRLRTPSSATSDGDEQVDPSDDEEAMPIAAGRFS